MVRLTGVVSVSARFLHCDIYYVCLLFGCSDCRSSASTTSCFGDIHLPSHVESSRTFVFLSKLDLQRTKSKTSTKSTSSLSTLFSCTAHLNQVLLQTWSRNRTSNLKWETLRLVLISIPIFLALMDPSCSMAQHMYHRPALQQLPSRSQCPSKLPQLSSKLPQFQLSHNLEALQLYSSLFNIFQTTRIIQTTQIPLTFLTTIQQVFQFGEVSSRLTSQCKRIIS